MSANEEPQSDRGGRAAWPILVAGVIVVVGVIAIVVANMARPADEKVNDSRQVSELLGRHYGAQSHQKYQEYVDTLCPADRAKAPTSQEFSTITARTRDAKGNYVVDTIEQPVITGATGSVRYTWHFDKDADAKVTSTTRLVKDGDNWTLCGLTLQ